MEKFEEAPEGIDIEVPTSAAGKDDAVTHQFSAGDYVEVCEGELMHLQGKIVSIDGNMIIVMPKHDDLTVRISFHIILFKDCHLTNNKFFKPIFFLGSP